MKTVMGVALWGFGVAWSPARAVGQCCGDCNGDGTVAISELVTAVNRALGSCSDDGVCDGSVATCAAQLDESQNDLASCRAQLDCHAFPSTGQITVYGSGSDGDVQAGAALSYTDNGDGTITDNNTGLMWEKKDDSGGIHDKDNGYMWSGGFTPGTTVTEFLAALNTPPCFAGHCDWRFPNVRELLSIVDYEIPYSPTVNAAFHNASGCAGCTDGTLASCSCTASSPYWSSTTYRFFPEYAWKVDFGGDLAGGGTSLASKNFNGSGNSNVAAVRAARGGDGPEESEQDRENRVREAVGSFYAAFNSAFEGPADFATEDWNHINPNGGWTRGRENVLAEVRFVHSIFLRGVTDTVEDMSVRFATGDVAVVVATSRVSTFTTPDGVEHVNEQHRRTFVVVERSGRWLVMQDQNTVVVGG